MEFTFDINNILGDEVTVVDANLAPYRTTPGNREIYRKQLCEIIDKMGAASTKAQGLSAVITSCKKLQLADHLLYIMKDAEANGGNGAIVGILKTGYKRLFMFDRQGMHHEVEPLCTLDFYVHESRQRAGCGKRLFQHMLQTSGLKAHQIAIDRPSPKFLSFLAKHYNLKASIPQVNNFVVFEGFFRDKSHHRTLDRRKFGSGRPPLHPGQKQGGSVMTDAVQRQGSTVSMGTGKNIYSKLEKENDILNGVTVPRSGSGYGMRGGLVDRPASGQSSAGEKLPPLALDLHARGMAAKQNGYSRHVTNPTPPPAEQERPPKEYYRASSPPMLQRDGPPKTYLKLANDYQGRRGHLRVGRRSENVGQETSVSPSGLLQSGTELSSTGQTKLTGTVSNPLSAKLPGGTNSRPVSQGILPTTDPYTSHSAKPRSHDTSWNVFGVPYQSQALATKTVQSATASTTPTQSRRYRNLYW